MNRSARKNLLWALLLTPVVYLLTDRLLPRDRAFQELARRGMSLGYDGSSDIYDIEDLHLSEAGTAQECILRGPDGRNFLVLLALRRDFPEVYEELPPAVRANILQDCFRHFPFTTMFGGDVIHPGSPTFQAASMALRELNLGSAVAGVQKHFDGALPPVTRDNNGP